MDERPFEELLDTGMLWLLNRATLHPRGFALAIHRDDDGKATGWSIIGDGTECWAYRNETDDEKFQAVEQFLNSLRPT